LTLWTILNSAFDNQLGNPISVENILLFLNNNKIAISDVIYECKRLNETALDKDLFDINYNPNLFNQIKSSNINEILFTSGFQKNNAFKLFYEGILNKKITKEIKVNRGVTLENSIFGRQIKLTVLYSPSGSANIGISKSKEYLMNKKDYQKYQNPIKHFKIQYYKKQFSTINQYL
jgi:G:T/U-mismatch repair DNA glycosylase